MPLLDNFGQQNANQSNFKLCEIENTQQDSRFKKYLTHILFSSSVPFLLFAAWRFKVLCLDNESFYGQSFLYKVQNSPKYVLLCFFLGISIIVLAICNYLYNYHYKNKILSKGSQYKPIVYKNKTNDIDIEQNKSMKIEKQEDTNQEFLNTENLIEKHNETKASNNTTNSADQQINSSNNCNKEKDKKTQQSKKRQLQNKENKSQEIRKKMDINFKKHFDIYGLKTPKVPSPKNGLYYENQNLKEYIVTLKNFYNEQIEKDKNLEGIHDEILNDNSFVDNENLEETDDEIIDEEENEEKNDKKLEIEKIIYVPKYLKKELETSKKILRSAFNSFFKKEQEGLEVANDTQQNIKKRMYLFNFWTRENGETMNAYTRNTILSFSSENMKTLKDYIPWMFPSSYRSEKYPNSVLIRKPDVEFYRKSKQARKTYLLMITKFKQYILDPNYLDSWAKRNKEDIYIALKSITELEGKEVALEFYNDIMEFIKKHNIMQSQHQNQINKNIQYWNTIFN